MAEIASERKISEDTVVKHLAHYVELGEIPVSKLVPDEIISLIVDFFKDTDDLSLSPAKTALGEKVSWDDLRLVVKHIIFIRKAI